MTDSEKLLALASWFGPNGAILTGTGDRSQVEDDLRRIATLLADPRTLLAAALDTDAGKAALAEALAAKGGPMTPILAAYLVVEAAEDLARAENRMLDRWAESDEAVKQQLWRDLHRCGEALRTALEEADERDALERSNR